MHMYNVEGNTCNYAHDIVHVHVHTLYLLIAVSIIREYTPFHVIDHPRWANVIPALLSEGGWWREGGEDRRERKERIRTTCRRFAYLARTCTYTLCSVFVCLVWSVDDPHRWWELVHHQRSLNPNPNSQGWACCLFLYFFLNVHID